MFSFANILSDLQAVIAAHAARNRALTVLLVAVWGRIARMKVRLEKLVALWRAGMLPAARKPRARGAIASVSKPRQVFPSSVAWLTRLLGYEVAVYGSQLRHLMTEDECARFLEDCPRAGRILRPLVRMLSTDPLPEIIRVVRLVAVEATAEVGEMVGVVGSVESQKLGV